jgi:hypothetical protein
MARALVGVPRSGFVRVGPSPSQPANDFCDSRTIDFGTIWNAGIALLASRKHPKRVNFENTRPTEKLAMKKVFMQPIGARRMKTYQGSVLSRGFRLRSGCSRDVGGDRRERDRIHNRLSNLSDDHGNSLLMCFRGRHPADARPQPPNLLWPLHLPETMRAARRSSVFAVPVFLSLRLCRRHSDPQQLSTGLKTGPMVVRRRSPARCNLRKYQYLFTARLGSGRRSLAFEAEGNHSWRGMQTGAVRLPKVPNGAPWQGFKGRGPWVLRDRFGCPRRSTNG